MGHGLEAWECLDQCIIALDKLLTDGMRFKIQKRRHSKEAGVAKQNIMDNVLYRKRVHDDDVKSQLDKTTKELGHAREASLVMRDMLIDKSDQL